MSEGSALESQRLVAQGLTDRATVSASAIACLLGYLADKPTPPDFVCWSIDTIRAELSAVPVDAITPWKILQAQTAERTKKDPSDPEAEKG